ncbi:unnamed protein product [Spirodela intermedia]|uniref:Uncharacterized protein n=1 Tax=Spirodela intermedia TaxID=51605 RepID=A0A7I8IDM8_SPIIN|nr:unnamed protein product [Spirodela intermedia]CAA6654951.1 unnamed protein product [Spirodela intermedia]
MPSPLLAHRSGPHPVARSRCRPRPIKAPFVARIVLFCGGAAPRYLPKLAYLISGTRGEGARLRRLLQAVYHPSNFYVVHIAASPDEWADLWQYVALEPVFRAHDNVLVMAADTVSEKGPTVVAFTLHAVAILLRKSENWDWFINLNAADYPLMPQDDLIHIFSYLPRDLNFIGHTSKIGWKEFERVRPVIVDPALYDSNKTEVFWAKEKRSVPSSFKLFVGPPWMVLTRSFLEFCIWGWDNLPRTLLLYYTNFLSSSESYFHTVICNSQEFQNTTVNHGLRFMSWGNPPQHQPLPLGLHHFDLMLLPDDALLDRIDRQLLRRADGRFTPGGWYRNGSTVGVRRRSRGVRYQPSSAHGGLGPAGELLVKLLDPEQFRAQQCE